MNYLSVGKRHLLYELKTVMVNFYIPFFGMVFPLILAIFICNAIAKDVPVSIVPEVKTKVVLTMLPMIGLSSLFLGEVSIFTMEVEKNITQRLEVFGFSKVKIVLAKYYSLMIFMLLSTAVYLIGTYIFTKFLIPDIGGFISVNLLMIVMASMLFLIAHSIALIFKRFNVSYGVSMVIYFSIMFFSGMLGLRPEDMPSGLRTISNMIPYSYVDVFYNIWMGKSTHYYGYLQSLIFLIGVAGVMFAIGLKKKWY